MKKLALQFVLICSIVLGSGGIAANAGELRMKPLEQILAAETSVGNTSTYLLRCFSLYTVTSNWLLSFSNERVKAMGQKLSDASTTIFTIWVELDKMQSQKKEADLEFLQSQTKIMAAEYTKLMSRSKALTSNVFEDPTVKSDLVSCRGYQQVLTRLANELGRQAER